MYMKSFSSVIKSASLLRSFATAPYVIRALPYAKNALAPVISENTLNCHYDGHHQTFELSFSIMDRYVNNFNNMTKGTDRKPLEHYITNVTGGVHNQAAQIWNHTFFWNCMCPGGKAIPEGELKSAILRDFGSVDKLHETFSQVATAHFGSGWAWLVHDPKENKLKVLSTPNEANPMQCTVSRVVSDF